MLRKTYPVATGGLLFVFLIFFLLNSCKKESGSSNPPPPPPVDTCVIALTNGLIGYWPFTGDFNDASGNGHNASPLNGAHLGTDKKGNASMAAEFDGMDDVAIVNEFDALNIDSGTVSFWFLVTNLNSRFSFINRISYNDAFGLSWAIQKPYSDSSEIKFAVADPAQTCGTYGSADSSQTVNLSPNIQNNTWYQMSVTYSHNVENIYLNGSLIGSQTTPYANFKKCSNSQLIFGGWWAQDIMSLGGKLDEIRIYNRTLRSCEITKLAADIP